MSMSTLKEKNIYSFDVFDTCLLRTCGFPSAVFRLTARALHKTLPKESITWSEDDFVIERVRSEHFTRTQTGNEEVTLHDIWKSLCTELDIAFNENLPALELECERKVLYPNPEILARINAIRQKGGQILFLSDMYLPYDFVLEALIQHGFFFPEDHLYLSSQIGLTKLSGNLYKYVLEKEKISSGQLHHLGDNRASDYHVPLKLGIKSNQYTGSTFTELEKRLLLTSQNDPLALMPLVCSMREYRLANPSSGLSQFVGKFLGPTLVLLALWVLQNAAKNGAKRLYFFSRDCQALAKVATVLSKDHFGIECCYLLVSRQALFLPSASDCTPTSMPWLFRSFEEPTLASLLAKLELNVNEWSDRFHSLHKGAGASYQLKGPEVQQKFWNILQEPDIRSAILDKIEVRRKSALQYFQDKGIFEQDHVHVVDLGWHGTCQTALKKIIESSEKKITVSGFYLGRLSYDGLSKSETGPMTGLFEQKTIDDPFNSINYPVFLHITKIEHILGMSDHPSVYHYEDGRPVFQLPDNTDLIQIVGQDIGLMHAELEKFANIYENLIDNKHLDNDLLRQCISILLNEFWSNPSADSLKVFSKISASVDQNNLNPKPLVSAYTHRQALRKLLPSRWFGNPPEPGDKVAPWREASYQLSPKSVKFLLKTKIYISRIKKKLNF